MGAGTAAAGRVDQLHAPGLGPNELEKGKRKNGRAIAQRTGWDVLLVFPPRRDGMGRGIVARVSRPELSDWYIGRDGRRWSWTRDGAATFLIFPTLWQAVEHANQQWALFRGTP